MTIDQTLRDLFLPLVTASNFYRWAPLVALWPRPIATLAAGYPGTAALVCRTYLGSTWVRVRTPARASSCTPSRRCPRVQRPIIQKLSSTASSLNILRRCTAAARAARTADGYALWTLGGPWRVELPDLTTGRWPGLSVPSAQVSLAGAPQAAPAPSSGERRRRRRGVPFTRQGGGPPCV